ncbi:MAG: FliI/YscN family ATPase [Vulcanimicrobiota bacterium]
MKHEPARRARQLAAELNNLEFLEASGRVCRVTGMLIESQGPPAGLGALCRIDTGPGQSLPAEVVGFTETRVLLMPIESMGNIRPGSPVTVVSEGFRFGYTPDLRGRVLDGLGRPIDGRPLPVHTRKVPLDRNPPSPLERPPVDQPLTTGVRAIDGLLTLGRGQRVGLFAGSGVGKSTLMGMLARGSEADINVIALIGERGREVGEFVHQHLGPEGLARSVVVAATSDRSPLERIKGAMLATAIAEAYRDDGLNVCLMMDSVTRVAMAQREVGLTVGEPPTSRGYTPSVFAVLPRLLERAGNNTQGSITGIYTVLVEGDDMNEPVADTVRGILDGHIILSRRLAHQNHYPAIDILGSVSRVMNQMVVPEHRQAAGQLRVLLADLAEARELLALGGYERGNSVEFDRALAAEPALNDFLRQDDPNPTAFPQLVARMSEV